MLDYLSPIISAQHLGLTEWICSRSLPFNNPSFGTQTCNSLCWHYSHGRAFPQDSVSLNPGGFLWVLKSWLFLWSLSQAGGWAHLWSWDCVPMNHSEHEMLILFYDYFSWIVSYPESYAERVTIWIEILNKSTNKQMNDQASYGWENSVGEACRVWFLEFFSSSSASIVRKDTSIFFCVSNVPFGHVSLCISLCSCLYFWIQGGVSLYFETWEQNEMLGWGWRGTEQSICNMFVLSKTIINRDTQGEVFRNLILK